MERNGDNKLTIGSKFEIREKGSKEVVESWTTNGEIYSCKNLKVQKEYVIVETKPIEGYTTAEEINFKIKADGTVVVEGEEQKEKVITIRDHATALQVEVKDEKTKEYVRNSKWQILKREKKAEEQESQVEKEENREIQEELILETTIEEGIEIYQKLPIGEYILRQIEKAEGTGYVRVEDSEFTIKDTKELQNIELEQKISKVLIKIKDEETKEKLEKLDVTIEEKGTGKVVAKTEEIQGEEEKVDTQNRKEKEILTIKEIEEGYYVERIEVGEYNLRQTVKEGYKEVEVREIKVEEKAEIQEIEKENRKLIYDMQIEKELESITIDGKKTEAKKGKLQKIEVAENKIKTIDIKLEYVIRVKNAGEIKAKIGRIIDHVPSGFKVESAGWKEEKGKAVWDAKEEELKPGESKEVRIILKWNNNLLNFGEKKNTASLEGSSNEYGYEDKKGENDIGLAGIVFSIQTGKDLRREIGNMVLLILSMVACIIIGIKVFTQGTKK